MRLEPLGELHLAYGERGFALVRPYGTEEGSGYGTGAGTITGERVRGTVSWLNAPRRRSDVVMLPHCHGLIDTDEGRLRLGRRGEGRGGEGEGGEE